MNRKYEMKPMTTKDFNEAGHLDYKVPIFHRCLVSIDSYLLSLQLKMRVCLHPLEMSGNPLHLF